MKYKIIDIHPYDAYYHSYNYIIGNIGETNDVSIENDNFSGCHFTPEKPIIIEKHSYDRTFSFYMIKYKEIS